MRPDFSAQPRPPRASFADLALLATAGFVFLSAAWTSWRASDRLSEYRAAAAQTWAAAKAERKASVDRHARSPRAALGAQVATVSHASPPVVLRNLQDLLPADVRLASIRLEYGAGLRVWLQVVARDPAAYDQFVDRLTVSPHFDAIVLGSENRSGEMTTSIAASYREGHAQ